MEAFRPSITYPPVPPHTFLTSLHATAPAVEHPQVFTKHVSMLEYDNNCNNNDNDDDDDDEEIKKHNKNDDYKDDDDNGER